MKLSWIEFLKKYFPKTYKRRYEEHHIWCNFFMRPRKGCKMCEGLFKKYPYDGMNPEDLHKKYFPNAIKVG